MSRVSDVFAQSPWLKEWDWKGLRGQIRDWVIEGYSAAQIVTALRQTNEYKARFAGMFDEEGGWTTSKYGSEADYLASERDVLGTLDAYGDTNHTYSWRDAQAFLRQGIDGSQLAARFQLYEQVQTAGQDVIDAFYVYAGQKISKGDLYSAIVDPAKQQRLIDRYNAAIAAQPLTAQKFLNRLTDVAMERAVTTIGQLVDRGFIAESVEAKLRELDPNQARRLVARIYARALEKDRAEVVEELGQATAANKGGRFLTMSVIRKTFERALIGSAASGQGFDLSVERIDELLTGGVTRETAVQGFSTLASQLTSFRSAARRANLGHITLQEAQDELLLGSGTEIATALRHEQALGQRTGSARFDLSRSGALQQLGLREQ